MSIRTSDESEPDINNRWQLAQAIADIDVLGGYARSYSESFEVDRYIEKLGDYVSMSDIEKAVASWFPGYDA